MSPLDERAPPDIGHPDQLPPGTRLGPYEITEPGVPGRRHDRGPDYGVDPVPGPAVTSRTSSMLYKGRRNCVPDIADELGVEWIVLASLAKAGSELRVAAQLVDARTDENRWAQSYIRGSRKTLFVQQEVAVVIARAIRHAIASRPAAGTRPVAV